MQDFPDTSSWHYWIDKAVVASVTIFVAFVAKRFIEGVKSKLAFKDEMERQRVARMGDTWSAIYEFEAAADDLLRAHATQVKESPMAIDKSKLEPLEARSEQLSEVARATVDRNWYWLGEPSYERFMNYHNLVIDRVHCYFQEDLDGMKSVDQQLLAARRSLHDYSE